MLPFATVLVTSLVVGIVLVDGQTYDTFVDLVDGLATGHIVTVNLELAKCITSLPPADINVALRHWDIVTTSSKGRVITVHDHFKGIDSDTWLMRKIEVRELTGKVEIEAVYYRAQNPAASETYYQSCDFNDGAVFHKMTGDLDETILVTSYDMLKSELLFGRHIVAVVDLHGCSGSSLPSGTTAYTFGMNLWNFLVVHDGEVDESIKMYSNYIASFEDGSTGQTSTNFSRNAFGIEVKQKRLDSVRVTHGAYSFLEGDDVAELGESYSCDNVKFYSRRYEKDGIYNTYGDVKQALLHGHQVEMVNFAKYCTAKTDPPAPVENNIRGQMFDAWWWRADINGTTEDEESIYFMNDVLSPTGVFSVEEGSVYPNDTLKFNALSATVNNVSVPIFQLCLQCYLGGSTVFHANLADKVPVTSYSQLKSWFLSRGAIFEAQINLELCTNVTEPYSHNMAAFIMWESFLVNKDPEGFEGVSVVLSEDIGTPDVIDRTAWQGSYLRVTPSGEATYSIRRFLTDTYEEITSFDASCVLNDGLKLYQYLM